MTRYILSVLKRLQAAMFFIVGITKTIWEGSTINPCSPYQLCKATLERQDTGLAYCFLHGHYNVRESSPKRLYFDEQQKNSQESIEKAPKQGKETSGMSGLFDSTKEAATRHRRRAPPPPS
ncbi:hypothetical protein GN244_ATG15251 [Phytophthora infestans]|uniref:Uncharacterized protein n=1 Tax=Phytophthora infestans TaxID=4787 RepID=A0A833ST84_PHYIN|nr:hypothetical protein GN244_ATG15251 [Phytophthora infestans]